MTATDALDHPLTGRVRGPVSRPGDGGYDKERAGFQTAQCHRPSLIVGATGAADVSAAVMLAAETGQPVAVQATGHGLATPAEDGVLITTCRMNGVRVDAESRTAWIAAGVRWNRVIHEAAPFGLAPLSGSSPDVGAVSYTLGGGLGLLSREFGYAADHVRAIDVVTADGRIRRVVPGDDLYWALLGGRDNFGVVTGMEIDLMPVDRIYGGALHFDADLVEDVLHTYLSWTATVPDELTSSVGLMPMPDLPMVPVPLRGRYVASVRVVYHGDSASGERLIAPLRAIGPRLVDSLAEMPYRAAASIYNDPVTPHAYHGDGLLLHDVDAETLRMVRGHTGPDAPVMCVVGLNHLGGALARPPATPNAIGHRSARYLLRILSPLDGTDATTTVRSVHRRVSDALGSAIVGRSLNFVFGSHGEVTPGGYEPADYRRLTELKAAYDPENLFRLNRNIPPATGRRDPGMSSLSGQAC